MGELSAAARRTMQSLCERRTGCGRCGSCRSLLKVAKRQARRVEDEDEQGQQPAPAPEPQPEPTSEQRPNARDSKAAWVDYAVSTGMDRAEADATTKVDLVAALS